MASIAAAAATEALSLAPAEDTAAGEGEWEDVEEEEVMVLVDLPEYGGVDLFEGARSIEIRVRGVWGGEGGGYCVPRGRAALLRGGTLRGWGRRSSDRAPVAPGRTIIHPHLPTHACTESGGGRGGAGGAGPGRAPTIPGAVRGPAGHDARGGRGGQGRH